MANDKKITLESMITEKMVFIHMCIVAGVCLAFGVINAVSGAVAVGIITALAGIVLAAVTTAIKKNTPITTRGTILSIAQLIVIIVISTAKHEMHSMFPLMLASMCIAAIYFNKKTLKIHMIIMDAAIIIGFFANDFFYDGQSIEFLAKGFLGINVGAAITLYLIGCCHKFIEAARQAEEETSGLLGQVSEQMAGTEKLIDKQNRMVAEVASISGQLSNDAAHMEEISADLNQAAAEQEQTLNEIAGDVAAITEETKKSFEQSERASAAAEKSNVTLHESDEQVRSMVSAMGEISENAREIESIIMTIEDIAFQTNILALNAAVEAARAGEAGKGFAVVADEVRNLATKSAQAANGTADLIKSTIESVDKGAKYANAVADNMTTVIRTSEESAEHSRLIADMTERQSELTASVMAKIEMISEVSAKNSATAVNSAEAARSVADEAEKMNRLVMAMRS